jgi:hypothetical protein
MLTQRFITIRIDRKKLFQTFTVLPTLLILMAALVWVIGDRVSNPTPPEQKPASTSVTLPTPAAYPQTGAELNPSLFALQLPPPPLDALPYDVREPLSNGSAVPVKKRWLWLPAGQAIRVTADGRVTVPVGALWWKEFYVETDRGTFLIERRIIARVAESRANPDGWAFYSAHTLDGDVVLPSSESESFAYQPTDWLPTQPTSSAVEVRFEDARGVAYAYVFPGQGQCLVCHAGASGAYLSDDPIQVFGLHPNNLTEASYRALTARGWLSGAVLLTPTQTAQNMDTLTHELVGVLRNNCASCHNASPDAAASFTAFILDPNANYNAAELLALLSVPGKMLPDAHPLVTPGNLIESEIWLRLNGLEGRRRMPPREGGLPEPDADIIDLWRTWILLAH